MDDFQPFDVTGPLPTGTTVLEASAGTGKTFTIAALVARWVAETTTPLPNLLVVTFTRAATAELRDRVRQRLVGCADHLEALIDGREQDPSDDVIATLADAPVDELRERHARLLRAISDVDVATISTIHGFCQHVLAGLGIASDLDREAELVEDVRDLIDEVVDDLFLTTYVGADADLPRLRREDVAELASVALANPTTRLVPTGSDDAETGLRLHLAQRVRAEVERRARRRRLLSYDDLLTRLEGTLRDPDRAAAARDALRERYRITLIDEFQDTDPVQWSIVRRAFTDDDADRDGAGRALVLIGDPKQAIYAFRGADVHAYLDAAGAAAVQRTLASNWRSDAGLLRAFQALFDGTTFGDPRIAFREVGAAPGRDAPGLVGAPSDVPLRIRQLPRHAHLPLTGKKIIAGDAQELIATDVAAEVVALLGAQPRIVERSGDGVDRDTRPLAPRDIAVLVRNHLQARLAQQKLREVDVAAVVGGSESVFATEAASAWQRLLRALERPASISDVRSLAATSWVGWTGDRIAAATDADWDALHDDVHAWARLFNERGVAAVHHAVMIRRDVRPRLLGLEGGERALADLEHVGELLHAAASADHLGIAGLGSWLRDRIQESVSDANEERRRRLETDDEAVQILTIHASKGLEFSVVLCPYLYSSNTSVRGLPVFHDPQSGERVLDVGGGHPDVGANVGLAEFESQGEELRLLYVALTRAKHQVVAWYAPAGIPEWSGLGRVLLNRSADGNLFVDDKAPLLEDDDIRAHLDRLAARASGTIAIEEVPAEPSTAPLAASADPPPALDRARFARDIDVLFRRTSYTGLTTLDTDEPLVGSEPVEQVKDDEADLTDVIAGPADDDPTGLRERSLLLGEMPGGPHIGTFVHEVMEHTDYAVEDLDAELGRVVRERLARRRVEVDPDALAAGLRVAIETPLGPSAGGITLRSLARSHRRDEVEFELPLDRAATGGAATVADILDLLDAHLPADDPLAHYAATVPAPVRARTLRGFLGGAIDLVLRRETEDGGSVFHVADHKTNRLGTWGEPLTAWDYRPAALADAMVHGDYPIQALLYQVALHRLLRWRLPGYDPDRHLGPALYLFLRGMAGPDVVTDEGLPCGVFAWGIPTPLVLAASDLLHGKVAA